MLDGNVFEGDNHAVMWDEEERGRMNFPEPTKKQASHLKALFLTTSIDGRKIRKVLVDDGASINIMTLPT